MGINEILQKSSPLIPQREMSKTEYMKLVDANTELVDKMNDLQERIDKAIEYINNLSNEPNAFGHYGIDTRCKNWLLNILKGRR